MNSVDSYLSLEQKVEVLRVIKVVMGLKHQAKVGLERILPEVVG